MRAPTQAESAFEAIGWGGAALDERERVARISGELERGFAALRDVEPAVSFFGTARSPDSSPDYRLARSVAEAVARTGFNVLTGGRCCHEGLCADLHKPPLARR